MRGLAKYVLIVASCLSAASSRSHPTASVEMSASTATTAIAGRGNLTLDLIRQARHEMPVVSDRLMKEAATVPEMDTWLTFVLGIGLVALQLRRKQKSLQAARMVG